MLSKKFKFLKAVVVSVLIISLVSGIAVLKGFAACDPGDCSDNPIIIDSIEDLEIFAQDLSEGIPYSGKFISLKSNICIEKNNKIFMKESANEDSLFKGVFDGNFNGNCHTITIKCKNCVETSEKSLFKSLGENAIIKDLNIKGNIDSISSNNYGNVENCYISKD